MIVTDNKKIAEKCFSLRNIFFNNFKRFVHYGLGWNARLTNIQASIGIAQLERLDEFVKIKRKIGDTYNKGLINNENYIKPLKSTSYGKNIYWVYGVVITKPKLSVNKIVIKLKKAGIETRPFFWPLHKQPILKKLGLFKNTKLPVSEYLSKNGFYLPSGLSLNKKQQTYVIKNFNKIIS
jgi:perosamine synthetase